MDTALTGAVIIGIINIAGLLFPNISTREKIILVVVVGAILPFVPLDHPVVEGIKIALASSGIYKVGQVVGSKK